MPLKHQGADEPTSGALKGVRVVEVATMYVGPLAAQYLGDLGADVIKVESPIGDTTRHVGPSHESGMGAFFLSCNRNKRSVCLDLKTDSGQQSLRDILRTADVLITSVRTEAAARLGMSYSEVTEYAPNIVYCHALGYSDYGPYGGRPAYDDVIQAISGLAAMQMPVTGGYPRYMPTILADKTVGVHLAYAALAALFHRSRTGRGQEVKVPMFETMAAFNLVEHLWGYTFDPPLSDDMGFPPVSEVIRYPQETRDGHVAIIPYLDSHWEEFFTIAGEPGLIDDPRLATFAARQRNARFAWGEIARLAKKRTTDEWLALLSKRDIPFGRLNTLRDLLADEHLAAIQFWGSMTDGTGVRLRTPNSQLRFSESPTSVRLGPPSLGQHTYDVLAECRSNDVETAES